MQFNFLGLTKSPTLVSLPSATILKQIVNLKNVTHRVPRWLGGPSGTCFTNSYRKYVSDMLLQLRKYYLSEYKRNVRTLDDVKFWKAVEFLSFLLYSGPFVLQKVLSTEKYQHFLYFHTALRLLSVHDPTPQMID